MKDPFSLDPPPLPTMASTTKHRWVFVGPSPSGAWEGSVNCRVPCPRGTAMVHCPSVPPNPPRPPEAVQVIPNPATSPQHCHCPCPGPSCSPGLFQQPSHLSFCFHARPYMFLSRENLAIPKSAHAHLCSTSPHGSHLPAPFFIASRTGQPNALSDPEVLQHEGDGC